MTTVTHPSKERKVGPPPAPAPAARPRKGRRGWTAEQVRHVAELRELVRAADRVNVYAEGVRTYLTVSKREARRVLRAAGPALIGTASAGGRLVYLEVPPF